MTCLAIVLACDSKNLCSSNEGRGHKPIPTLRWTVFLPCLSMLAAFCASQAVAQEPASITGQIDFDWQQFSFPTVTMATPSIRQQSLTASGAEVGISATMPLSQQPDAFTFTWSGTRYDLSGHSASTASLANNPFNIAVGSPSPGEIDLEALTDTSGAAALANVSFTDRAGSSAAIFASASSPTGPNSVTQYAVSQTAAGAAFTALATNGSIPGAAAYGAYADSNGLLFSGVNESSPGTVHAWSFVHATGYTQTVWLAKPLISETDLAFKVGATYRSGREHFGNGLTFDLADEAVGAGIPPVSLSETGSFRVESGGPMLGFEAHFRPHAPFSVELTGTAGVAMFGARSRTSQEIVLPVAGSIEEAGSTHHANGAMGLAGLQLSLVFPLQEQIELRVSGGVDATLWGPRPTATGIGRTTSSQYDLGLSLAAHF